MQLLLFLLLLHYLAANQRQSSLSINASASVVSESLFKATFQNCTSLCYIHEKDIENRDIVLKHIKIPILRVEFNGKVVTTDRVNQIVCQGYILNIKNLQAFKMLLQNRDPSVEFIKNHRRMAILYNGKAPVRFEELLGLYAIDVMEFEIYYNEHMEFMGCRVVRLYDDKVLFQWEHPNPDYYIDPGNFNHRRWDIKNFFKTTNYKFRFSVFNCEPFIYIQDGKLHGGTEFNLAQAMTRGFPVEFVFTNEKISKCNYIHLKRCIK